MPGKKKEHTFTKREYELAEMRNGRIGKEYLQSLVMDYKFKKKIDSRYSMPRELAEVVIIIIDKMLGSPSWRRYSEDWKEEFRGRAIEHVLKYALHLDLQRQKLNESVVKNQYLFFQNFMRE